MQNFMQYDGSTAIIVAGAVLVVYVGIRLMAGGSLGKLDWVLVAMLATVIGIYGMPMVESQRHQTNEQVLTERLILLRSSIKDYRQQHAGQPPVVVAGTFPQLMRRTNGQGIPGQTESKFPYGPYLAEGVPVNPISGVSVITVVDEFPPTVPSGNRGWLYHPKTGLITADLPGYLEK